MIAMPTAVRSQAKINLGLHIGAPRADGFHGLATVYQTLEVHDTVTVAARRAPATALRLSSNDSRVPTDARNTAWKMTALALEALGVMAEVEIHIEKRLPVQGGLGAGSANAVAALIGLEQELGLKDWSHGGPDASLFHPSRKMRPKDGADLAAGDWTWPRRLHVAAQVGSDVPLFLVGGTVLGVDRGQEVYPLPDIPETWCVIAAPAVGISTPQAFRDWDALCAAEGLTAERSAAKLSELSRTYASAFGGTLSEDGQEAGSSGVLSVREDLAGPQESALVRTGIDSWIQNDFERVVFPQYPTLCAIKRLLAGEGTPEAAILASLSGSGSALFGLYHSREDAEAAQRRLRADMQGANVRSTVTYTLPRSRYWREMLLEEGR
jgi:4-diphosphocytidyl-2-C-methyl-D-erythritol kinase